jgi:hypothetical protein
VDQGTDVALKEVDWAAVIEALAGPGWVRLEAVVNGPTCAGLLEAAGQAWRPLVEDEAGSGVVRQGGLSYHAELAKAAPIVGAFAEMIEAGVNSARSPLPELPGFNHAQWGRSVDGVGFITAHRDPPGAGGIIAVTTLTGRARFRVWDDDSASEMPSSQHARDGAHEWDTADGDLVLLRGSGWPSQASRCPLHEVESPLEGHRVILTLRHNKGGYGADYFASSQ